MSIQGKSLHVLTPMYGGVCTGTYHESMVQLVGMLLKYNIPFLQTYTYNESLINRARNRLCDVYLKESELTHCVHIDADIGFHAEDVLGMLEADKDIIGAPCVKKNIKWDRVQSVVKRSNGHLYTPQELLKVSGDFVVTWERGGKREIKLDELQAVSRLGTGLLMIRRNVLTTYQEKYPDRWYESRGDPAALPGPIHEFFRSGINPDTHEYESEDYCFCNDCKLLGFRVWLVPWMRTTHTGTHTYVGDMPVVAMLAGEIK